MAATRPNQLARSALVRVRRGPATALLYGVLAALSFPTLELLRWGTGGPVYAADVFDPDGGVPRIGATLSQLASSGPSLWDPGMVTGVPALAHGALTPIAPDVIIGLFAGPFAAFVITGWLLAFLAGLGMHRFLRDSVHLPTAACILGATIYLFSFWHYVYGFAAVIAPLAIWAVDRLATSRGSRSAPLLIGVGAVALGTYAGLGQIALLVGGLNLVWVVVGSTAGTLRSRLRAWLAIWGLGLAIYLPVILTQAGLLPISVRTIWDIPYLYETRPIPSLLERLQFYSATILGIPIGADLGRSPMYYGTYFTGAVGLVCIGALVILGRRRRAARFAILVLLAIPILDWAATMLVPALEPLGTLQTFQFVRIRHLLPFALALGVAIGATRLVAFARLRAVRSTSVVVGLAAVVGAFVGWQVIVALGRVGRSAQWSVVGRDLLAAALIVGLTAVTVALGTRAMARGRAGRRIAPAVIVVLLLLVAGERLLYAHGERLAGGHLGDWQTHLALTPTQAAIGRLGGPEPGRTLTLGDDPNRMWFHGLETVDGYVALYPVRYHALFRVLIDRCLEADPATRAYYDGWGQRVYAFCPELDPAVLDLLGVRWIDALGATPDVPGLVERFRDGTRSLFENLDPLPRAFLVGGTTVVPDTSAAQSWLGSADRTTLAGAAVVLAGEAAGSLPTAPGPAGSARITRSEPDRVDVALTADRPALLVLTDVAYPDWGVEVDGRPATVVPVDLAFRGVAVPAGDHQVTFRYRPVGTWLGFAVAGIALLLTILTALWLWRRDRRPGRAGSATVRPPSEAPPGPS